LIKSPYLSDKQKQRLIDIKTKIEKLEIKSEFIKALRRYITRYLLGNKNIFMDLKEENLLNELYRSDLWGINEMRKFGEIKNVLNTGLKNIHIKIKHSLTLYENICKEDREYVKDFVKKKPQG